MKRLLALVLTLLILLTFGCTAPATETETEISAPDTAIVTDPLALSTSEPREISVSPTDYAYVRSGKYGDMTWRALNRELELDTNNDEPLGIKNNGSDPKDFAREIFLEFDLTDFFGFDFETVYWRPSWTKAPEESYCVDVYIIDPDSWSGDCLTYNKRPPYTTVGGKYLTAGGLNGANLTDAVRAKIEKGEKTLSIAIVGTRQSEGEFYINPKTTTLVATTAMADKNFVRALTGDKAQDDAIWQYAEKTFRDWYLRYNMLKRKDLNPDARKVVSDEDEFNKTVFSGNSGMGQWNLDNVNKPHATRTYEALDDLGKYTDYKQYDQDVYGGWMNPAMRQKATGFFYSKKIDGRWWFIDPLGYPCIVRTISGPTINYLNSPNQRKAALEKYGSPEKWEIATIRWLKDEVGINGGRVREGFSAEEPLVTELSIGGFAAGYGKTIGTNISNGGSTRFGGNDTMNVFDPGFVDYADSVAAASLPQNVDNPWITGYTTDNELPMDANMLTNYLTLNPTESVYHYSYAAAWTFMIHMTENENPSAGMIDGELKQLFRGFVYDRYFNVVSTAFHKYDPNHMLLGCRFLTKVKDAPWVLRFASLYLDGMTINWYGQWTPNADNIYQIARYADLPLEITEFYTKALENDGSFDDPFDPLKNTRGAGWIVRTQQDRGDFYENFTLRLLETRVFVAWQWHQYLDDDDSPEVIYLEDGRTWRDQSNIDANKGIVNNWHEPYEELCESMAQINFNCYRLALHFDAKYNQ